jgi:hypothetical protein
LFRAFPSEGFVTVAIDVSADLVALDVDVVALIAQVLFRVFLNISFVLSSAKFAACAIDISLGLAALDIGVAVGFAHVLSNVSL